MIFFKYCLEVIAVSQRQQSSRVKYVCFKYAISTFKHHKSLLSDMEQIPHNWSFIYTNNSEEKRKILPITASQTH